MGYKTKYENIPDEIIDEFLISEGMPRSLIKALRKLSSLHDKKSNPYWYYHLDDTTTEDDDECYGFCMYETIRYPPQCTPPECNKKNHMPS